VNWEYFIDNGLFKAKRLPATSGAVKIKDVTDLDDLRAYLKEADSVEESIKAYEHCFDDPCMYDIEVETFEEYFNRNPNKFLGDVGKLKGKLGFIEELREWDEEDQEYGWIFIDDVLGKQLDRYGIVEIKKDIGEDDWIEFLENKYKVKDMKSLGERFSIPLKGNKANMIKIFYDAIESGLVKHDKPCAIRPGGNIEKWFGEVQVKFVSEVEFSLSKFDYPKAYTSAVWDMVVSDNSEYDLLVNQINNKYGSYLNKENYLRDDIKESDEYTTTKMSRPHKSPNIVSESNRGKPSKRMIAIVCIVAIITLFLII